MRKRGWKLAVCLSVFFLAAGCKPQEQEAEPTQMPEVTQVVLAPVVNVWTEATEGLKESLEKTDASEQAKYNAMNRMLSYDAANGSSLFCVDADTGVVYFVNQNKDYYIYRIKDGVAELAVSMAAKALYTYDGSLYFMAESYGKYKGEEKKDGDIYCYTPEDGTVKLVYAFDEGADRKTCKMLVNEDGIYFSVSERGEEQIVDGVPLVSVRTISYCLPFGEQEAVPDDLDMTILPRWRDYKLGSFRRETDSALLPPLALLKGKEYRDLCIGRPVHYCVMDDSLYYYVQSTQDAGLAVLDLVTGEKEEYRAWEALKKVYRGLSEKGLSEEKAMDLSDEELAALLAEEGGLYHKGLIDYFTATKQYFWLSSNAGSYLIRIDKESKETAAFKIKGVVQQLYTDGEQLYAMYALNYGSVPSLVKVLTDQPVYNEATGEEYVEVEYLTK